MTLNLQELRRQTREVMEEQFEVAVADLKRQLQRQRDFHRERFMRFYLESLHNGFIPLREGKAMRVFEETWSWDTKMRHKIKRKQP